MKGSKERFAISYYHVSSRQLPVGSIISAGNWGRTVLALPGHPWLQMEMMFERARRNIDPDLPSRLYSSFMFTSVEQADRYLATQPDKANEFMYEVRPRDETKRVYRTSLMLVHPNIGTHPGAAIPPGNAFAYWRMKGDERHEIEELLTESDLVVLQVLGV